MTKKEAIGKWIKEARAAAMSASENAQSAEDLAWADGLWEEYWKWVDEASA